MVKKEKRVNNVHKPVAEKTNLSRFVLDQLRDGVKKARGRPRVPVNLELLRQIHKETESTRKTAALYYNRTGTKISKSAVHKLINGLSINSFTDDKTKSKSELMDSCPLNQKPSTSEVSENQPKPAQVSSDVPITTYNNNNTTTVRSFDSEFHNPHKIRATISYTGIVSEGKAYKAGNKKNQYEFRKVYTNNGIIDARPHTITIYANNEAIGKSDDADKLLAKARTVLIQELGELAERNNLQYERNSFKMDYPPHWVENMLIKADKQAKAITSPEGVLLGDSSHVDKIEFIGNDGTLKAKTFLWVLNELPATIEKIVKVVKEEQDEIQVLTSNIGAVNRVALSMEENNNSIKDAIVKLEERDRKTSEELVIIRQKIGNVEDTLNNLIGKGY